MADKITLEYIQFSKRITRWSISLVSVIFVICLILIAFRDLPQYAIATINSLYTAYITIMGITVGAYQGNSSLEKWTKAKYNYDSLLKESNSEDTEIIEDIEDTYG